MDMNKENVVPIQQQTVAAVDEVIRRRKTTKLLLSHEHRERAERAWSAQHREELATIMEGASWAPFHRRAQSSVHRTEGLVSALPWRFYVVAGESCTALLSVLEQQAEAHPDSQWSRAWQSKIKDMISACGALIQVTWLPDLKEDSNEPEMSIGNMEHIAAASAAVQNVLLAAEARGWYSYWSSGGLLRDPEVFNLMDIPLTEVLLGSLFLSPEAVDASRKVAGGLREERGEVADWVRWVSFDQA